MRPTTLSKFEVNVLQPLVNLGIVTENAANNGVAALVVAPDHVASLIVQRGMMRSTHKIICALDFQGQYFGLDKFTRLKASPIGADGYEIMLSVNRTSIDLLNEIRVLTSFIRSNSPFAEIRWVVNLSRRTESEVQEIMKHLAQHPPTAIRLESGSIDKATSEDILRAVTSIRKFSNAQVKVPGNNQDLIKALIGNRDIKAFDIPDSKLLEMSKFIAGLSAHPAAKKPVSQFTTEDFNVVVADLQKPDANPTPEQLSEYVSRCKVLGPAAEKHLEYLEDCLLIKTGGASKEVT